MKIFAIRDESAQEQKDLAYLLYYEQEKRFYIELPENADAWETPLLLDSFVKRGETTVNSYWSRNLGGAADRSDRPPEHRRDFARQSSEGIR